MTYLESCVHSSKFIMSFCKELDRVEWIERKEIKSIFHVFPPGLLDMREVVVLLINGIRCNINLFTF